MLLIKAGFYLAVMLIMETRLSVEEAFYLETIGLYLEVILIIETRLLIEAGFYFNLHT